MAQRRSRGEQIVRDVNFALWSANDVFRKVSADAAARGGAWMRRVQENVSAGAEHLGENLAASQQAQRGAVRAIVPLPRPAPIPTRPKAGPAKPAPATRAARLTTPANREPQSIGDHALEAALHVDAAVRGAADVLTASKADEIAAFLDAGVENAVASMSGLFDPASSDNRPFHVSLATQLKRQRERDGFDAENRTFARVTGQAGGLVAGVGLGSGFGSVTGLVRMLPNGAKLIRNTQATKRIGLDTRGINTLAATGGAIVGVADQAIEDRLNGSLADYLPREAPALPVGSPRAMEARQLAVRSPVGPSRFWIRYRAARMRPSQRSVEVQPMAQGAQGSRAFCPTRWESTVRRRCLRD